MASPTGSIANRCADGRNREFGALRSCLLCRSRCWFFTPTFIKANWLFHSARHRVVIWGTAAEEVMRSPPVIVSARMPRAVAMRKAVSNTRAGQAEAETWAASSPATPTTPIMSICKSGTKLGAIGALLFLSIGLLTLQGHCEAAGKRTTGGHLHVCDNVSADRL